MIKYLYSEADERMLSKSLKADIIICVFLLITAVVVGVFTCHMVNDDNATILKVINIIESSMCLCTTAYFALNRIIPKSAKRTYIEKILDSSPIIVRGKVIGDGKKITVLKRITLIELCIINEEGKESVLYWDSDIVEPDFIGHIIEFYVVNNK